MKAATKLKVLRVIHIHRRQRAAEEPLAQATNARCKENSLRHVKPCIREPRQSCYAAGHVKTCAHEKWTGPSEEREIARGVLQIVAALEVLALHCHCNPAVERRYSYGCQHGDCAPNSIVFRQQRTSRRSAIVLRFLRTGTRHNAGRERRTGGKEHTQQRVEIHCNNMSDFTSDGYQPRCAAFPTFRLLPPRRSPRSRGLDQENERIRIVRLQDPG